MLLMVSLVSHSALASCNPNSGEDIYESSSYSPSRFVYSRGCHTDYGRLRVVENERKIQVEHLKKSIEFKDLALATANQRVDVWQKTTYKVEDKLIKLEKSSNRLKWIYFGLGVLIMGGATYGASKLK